MTDKPGLSIESASSIVAHDMIQKHMGNFAFVIRTDYHASTTTATEYLNGTAGVLALTIAGGHGSREEVLNMAIKRLREFVDRDLSLLARQ